MEKPYIKFGDNWRNELIELGRLGKSNKDIFKHFKIGHTTHFNLLRRSQEYKDAYDEYLIQHEAHWLNKAKHAIENNEEFNTKFFFLLMGNKHRKTWNNKNAKNNNEG